MPPWFLPLDNKYVLQDHTLQKYSSYARHSLRPPVVHLGPVVHRSIVPASFITYPLPSLSTIPCSRGDAYFVFRSTRAVSTRPTPNLYSPCNPNSNYDPIHSPAWPPAVPWIPAIVIFGILCYSLGLLTASALSQHCFREPQGNVSDHSCPGCIYTPVALPPNPNPFPPPSIKWQLWEVFVHMVLNPGSLLMDALMIAYPTHTDELTQFTFVSLFWYLYASDVQRIILSVTSSLDDIPSTSVANADPLPAADDDESAADLTERTAVKEGDWELDGASQHLGMGNVSSVDQDHSKSFGAASEILFTTGLPLIDTSEFNHFTLLTQPSRLPSEADPRGTRSTCLPGHRSQKEMPEAIADNVFLTDGTELADAPRFNMQSTCPVKGATDALKIVGVRRKLSLREYIEFKDALDACQVRTLDSDGASVFGASLRSLTQDPVVKTTRPQNGMSTKTGVGKVHYLTNIWSSAQNSSVGGIIAD
ncbi:hypothetical protein Hypma_014834 [Hypsizygus marmoreus]|uniref:Uncharacterized protein n=1 Tax=Hypsizygus marmoreus TaxID=39966 RepID=A0A369K9Q1_HYPMA|nr:hypothetical protein Hypma_014834 [Hypsizygus marmoreus]